MQPGGSARAVPGTWLGGGAVAATEPLPPLLLPTLLLPTA